MIRVARGAEPPELRRERYLRLSKALLERARNSGALPDKYDFSGYQAARHALYNAQYRKCAYCERLTGLAELPTEHFRPKDGAARVRGVKAGAGEGQWDADVYWWLAWTWENLLFSCKTCNGTSHKGNYFPIQGPSLPVGSYDLSAEDALIVDPSREDPLDHVRWVPLKPADPREEWEWIPAEHGAGGKGSFTIEAFKMLSRDDLVPQVSAVLQNEIVRPIGIVEDHLRANRVQAAAQTWLAIQQNHMYREAQFLGAKWSALVYLRDRPGSLLRQLPDPPRPGATLQPWVVPVGLPVAPAGIPHDAWVRLLADQLLDEALVLILQASPLQLKALWTLLKAEHCRYQPTKPQLREYLDQLVNAGKVLHNDDIYEAIPTAAASLNDIAESAPEDGGPGEHHLL